MAHTQCLCNYSHGKRLKAIYNTVFTIIMINLLFDLVNLYIWKDFGNLDLVYTLNVK